MMTNGTNGSRKAYLYALIDEAALPISEPLRHHDVPRTDVEGRRRRDLHVVRHEKVW